MVERRRCVLVAHDALDVVDGHSIGHEPGGVGVSWNRTPQASVRLKLVCRCRRGVCCLYHREADGGYDDCSGARIQCRGSQLDADLVTLGLRTRSDAIREGLRLLHREARQAALAQEYDLFYGTAEAPVSDVAAVGDRVAAEAMRLVDANR